MSILEANKVYRYFRSVLFPGESLKFESV